MYQKALAIRRMVLGERHPDTATSLYNLGLLYYEQGKNAQALPLLNQAWAIRRQILGSEHPQKRQLAQEAFTRTLVEQAVAIFEQDVAIRQGGAIRLPLNFHE